GATYLATRRGRGRVRAARPGGAAERSGGACGSAHRRRNPRAGSGADPGPGEFRDRRPGDPDARGPGRSEVRIRAGPRRQTRPHPPVAGATGSRKSVGLNTMIRSLLFTARPDEVKFLLIAPQMLELTVYEGIPHLWRPVITQPKAASRGLMLAVKEMGRRYKL